MKRILKREEYGIVSCSLGDTTRHTDLGEIWSPFELWSILYICAGKKSPRDVDPNRVFACNELDLGTIEVYGFDYDYTLANYNEKIEELIYYLAKNRLIIHFGVSFKVINEFLCWLSDYKSSFRIVPGWLGFSLKIYPLESRSISIICY